MPHRSFLEIAFGVSSIKPWRDEGVSEPEGGALENMRNPRMDVLLVSGVLWQSLPEESGQIFVEDDVLQKNNSPLKTTQKSQSENFETILAALRSRLGEPSGKRLRHSMRDSCAGCVRPSRCANGRTESPGWATLGFDWCAGLPALKQPQSLADKVF